MYQIAVCEDKPHLRAGLYAHCQNILGKLETEHEAAPFSSAEKLGSISADGARFDLLFLDIFLVEQNGMEPAHKVRKWDEQVSILFITSSTEFLLEGYGVPPHPIPVQTCKAGEAEKSDFDRSAAQPPPPHGDAEGQRKNRCTVSGGYLVYRKSEPWPHIPHVRGRPSRCLRPGPGKPAFAAEPVLPLPQRLSGESGPYQGACRPGDHPHRRHQAPCWAPVCRTVSTRIYPIHQQPITEQN